MRSRNPIAKRQAILRAALDEMAWSGYGGAKTDSIAQRAQVSVGTIYKLFKSKEQLANAVFIDCLGRVQAAIAIGLNHKGSPKEAFDLMWKSYTDLYFQDSACLLFFDNQLHDHFLDETSRAARQSLRTHFQAWIATLQEQGHFVSFPTETLRALAIGSFARIVRESADRNTQATRELFTQLGALVWQSISTDKPSE